MEKLKQFKPILFAIFGFAILWSEYRFDQTSSAPISKIIRLNVILGDWDSVYSYLQNFYSDSDKNLVWPKTIKEMELFVNQKKKLVQPSYDYGTQEFIQTAMVNYFIEGSEQSKENFKWYFSIFAEVATPETVALALYGWQSDKTDPEMKALLALYLVKLDQAFSNRAISESEKIQDQFLKDFIKASAELQIGNSQLAQKMLIDDHSISSTPIHLKNLLLSDLAAGLSDPIRQINFLEKASYVNEDYGKLILAYKGYLVFTQTLENFPEAINWLKKISVSSDHKNWLSFWTGRAYHQSNQFESALSQYNSISSDFIRFDVVLEKKSIAYNQLKKFDESVPLLTDLNKRKPSSIIQKHLAYGLENTGRPQEAEALLKQVAQANPNEFDSYFDLAKLQFYHLDKLDEASENFKIAQSIDPKNPLLQKTMNDFAIANSRRGGK